MSEIAAWVAKDEDIQYIWSMIAFNIPDTMSEKLLNMIIQEWTVLRGHSYRRTMLEIHKKNKDSAQGKRSLRKELQREHDSHSCTLRPDQVTRSHVTPVDNQDTTFLNQITLENLFTTMEDNNY